MTPKSKISIAMAVYNGERFIQAQLDSFVGQTRLPDELVVSDNASTDRTVEIVREFAARAPFLVRLLINKSNLGVAKNFECAIRECSGEIIFLSDCDDIWYPNRVALTEEALDSHPRAGVAICDADLVDEQLRPMEQRLWPWRGFRNFQEVAGLAEGTTFDRTIPCYGVCIAFRASFRSLVLPLPDGPVLGVAGHDTFIVWCIVGAGAGGIALINAPLLAYRQHPAQMTKQGQVPRMPRWKARTERPTTVLLPLIERLETDTARVACVNHKMREAALRHWRSRVFLPAGRLSRSTVVVREYLAGRYNEFSDGLTTAVKDLLFVR